jgi:pimeloyl-ACP methyl ester carboxylesterase
MAAGSTSAHPTRVRLPTGLHAAVRTWGPPDGAAPLVLVHGFLDAGAAWEEVAAALAERLPGRRIVAPDLRGHGDTDRVGAGGYYHFFDYVADLEALLAELGLTSIDLVGHSMGGMVASYFAGTRPAAVRRLALLEGLGPPEPPLDGDALPQRTRAWLDAWARARAEPERALADLDAAAARLRKHDPLLSLEQARLAARRLTRALPSGGLVWKHDPVHLTPAPIPFRRAHAEPFWRAITAEVLIVDGAASTLRLDPADAAARIACLARARRVELAGAGHMMMRHQPGALATLLADFVAA